MKNLESFIDYYYYYYYIYRIHHRSHSQLPSLDEIRESLLEEERLPRKRFFLAYNLRKNRF